jgi:hypothetical protein
MSGTEVIRMPRRPPHPGDLQRRIRGLAADGKVSFGPHVFEERGPERGIDINDALRVLKRGMIKGDIEAGAQAGEWKCKVVDQAEGSSRWIGVVVAVGHSHLFLITVEWEDT